MKKLLSSILLVLVSFAAFAQAPAGAKNRHEQKSPEEKATAITSHLEKNLSLTADQKTKVHDLALTREQKMDELRKQNKGNDRCAWADQRKQAQDAFDSGMKQTLTPDQLAKWNAQKAAHKKEMEAHRDMRAAKAKTPEQRADSLAGHLQKELGLSADQKTKVHDLVLTREQSIAKLRESHKDQDPCSWKDERKKVQDTFDSGMKSTLSPEQFQKWQTLKKQQEEKRKEHMQSRPKQGK